MDDRKAPPPQAVPEEDSKLPAVAPVLPPTPREEGGGGKKLKDNSGRAVPASASGEEVIDVAATLDFKPGDRIEVKWTINDDDDDSDIENEGAEMMAAKADGTDEPPTKSITVWWAATLSGKTNEMHTLSEDERTEGSRDYSYKSSSVKVPIYKLNYSPLEELGFDSHSLEDVAFVSNKTLLNLSTDEMMIFRRAGMPSPPSSPAPVEEEIIAKDESVVAKGFNSQEDVGQFMNQLMQQCLKNTGTDKKMKDLPVSEQMVMAERIQKAKEGLLAKMMEEAIKMKSGSKVVTADVVRKCMSQMEGEY